MLFRSRDRFLGFTGEHLARRLEIRARVPGYACKLDLEFEDGQKNILDLTAEGGVLCTDLRREYVACHGRVLAQVRGLKGDEVIKSNVFELVIVGSVDAADSFEPLAPGEFEQMERTLTGLKTDTEAAADRAAALTAKMPLPLDGTWRVWDESAGAYRDTGEPSRGEAGAQGEKGDPGEQGPQGVQGEKGEPFRYEDFTPEQLEALRGPQGETGARGAQGPPGEKGDPGERGPQGEKGNTGEGFRLADQFDSFAELEAAVPEPEAGSAYGVGTAPPYDVYIYSPSKGWVNHGPLQGAKGDPGPQGERGERGERGEAGPQGERGEAGPQGPAGAKGDAFTYADFTAEQLEALRGPQGLPGQDAPEGVAGALWQVTLTGDGWEDGAQAILDARLLAAANYAYLVAPDGGSRSAYSDAGVFADDVTEDGRLLFHTEETPETSLAVNVLRMEVPEYGENV